MNKYEIIGIVGEGAYGIVYKAKNKDTGEFVAIKKFKESAEEDQIVKKTTKREVKMLNVLKDKSVVKMIEAFKRKGRLYLVFEFMDRNLLEVLEEKPDGLDRDSVKYFIYQLLKAVDYFHSQNVMHRDIKPENLLICSKTNELKVCDFGFARHISLKSGLDRIHSSSNQSSNGDERSGNVSPELTDYVATRWYRSPELLLVSSNLPYGKEVDIWAIGCIMGELMDGQPLFPGDSEVDQLFVIQKVLGPLPEFLQDEFNRNSRYQGLKFPDIPHPETVEARYAAVMNDTEINLMQKMLQMDPYQRITARQAIEHDWFDDLRAKDPEYVGDDQSSEDHRLEGNESTGQILGGNKRVLSPELLNQRQRGAGSTDKERNYNLTNKNSYSHASHHTGIEPSRRSENNYHVQNAISNVKSSQGHHQGQMQANAIHAGGGSLPAQNGKYNSSQQNMIGVGSQGPNNRGSNGFMNLTGSDPLQANVSRAGPGSVNDGANQSQLNKSLKQKEGLLTAAPDQDYNYNINLDNFAGSGGPDNTHDNSGIIASSDVKMSSGIIGGTGGPGKNINNPLLSSVQTQGSLKADAVAQNINVRNRGAGAKGSGLSKGSHNGSAINITKKDGSNANKQSRTDQITTSNNRVGSINSNPGSTASRGSKYNIHQQNMASNQLQQQLQQQQNLYAMQNSQSPPSVRNKIQMHKIMKNSNSKSNNQKNKNSQNQYTMYQSNHMPMTSQQSRRKSQVSINNMMNNQNNIQGANQMVDPLQMMNFHQQMGGPMTSGFNIQGGGFGGMSDTGAPPDSSGSMMNMNIIAGSNNMNNLHNMQIYQSNFNQSSLAHYQAMNQMGNNPNNSNQAQFQQYNSQDKKRSNKLSISKQNINNIRLNMQNQQNQFDQQQFLAMNNNNMPLSSNAVLHHENWGDDHSQNNSLGGGGTQGSNNGMMSRGGHHSQGPGSHYKVGSKLKLGAATSTNFMKGVNQNNNFNMSMLRSVQQNMPNSINRNNMSRSNARDQQSIEQEFQTSGNSTYGDQMNSTNHSIGKDLQKDGRNSTAYQDPITISPSKVQSSSMVSIDKVKSITAESYNENIKQTDHRDSRSYGRLQQNRALSIQNILRENPTKNLHLGSNSRNDNKDSLSAALIRKFVYDAQKNAQVIQPRPKYHGDKNKKLSTNHSKQTNTIKGKKEQLYASYYNGKSSKNIKASMTGSQNNSSLDNSNADERGIQHSSHSFVAKPQALYTSQSSLSQLDIMARIQKRGAKLKKKQPLSTAQILNSKTESSTRRSNGVIQRNKQMVRVSTEQVQDIMDLKQQLNLYSQKLVEEGVGFAKEKQNGMYITPNSTQSPSVNVNVNMNVNFTVNNNAAGTNQNNGQIEADGQVQVECVENVVLQNTVEGCYTNQNSQKLLGQGPQSNRSMKVNKKSMGSQNKVAINSKLVQRLTSDRDRGSPGKQNMKKSGANYSSQSNIVLADSSDTAFVIDQRSLINLSPIQEYNYKIPAVASQSKIISMGSQGAGGSQGSSSIGAAYRGNNRKFVMQNPNQMQMVAEIQRGGPGTSPSGPAGPMQHPNQQRPQRAATQGGHIFGGQMGRSHAYGQMGSKLNKIHQNQQKFASSNMHDNSLSNGYLMLNQSQHGHGSPKYNSKSKYFSNQHPPIMNMKFPTTSHGNRSSTNHNTHGNNQQFNHMQNVLGNIQKHI